MFLARSNINQFVKIMNFFLSPKSYEQGFHLVDLLNLLQNGLHLNYFKIQMSMSTSKLELDCICNANKLFYYGQIKTLHSL
jgi:hypothetical protein